MALLAAIDGDIPIYQAAAAAQTTFAWDDGDTPQQFVNPDEALSTALRTLETWTSKARATRTLVCLTGSGNFRKTILPTYKANRAGVIRPLALAYVREGVRKHYRSISVDGLEADDLLGMLVSDPKNAGKVVCVSTDKDLKGTPGLHLNPNKDDEPVEVSEAQANLWWFTQAITGDTADGYKGAPGVGPKGAQLALQGWDGKDCRVGWEKLRTAFQPKRGAPISVVSTDRDALVQLRVARILRHGDYDKKKREVTLWHPTNLETLSLDALDQVAQQVAQQEVA